MWVLTKELAHHQMVGVFGKLRSRKKKSSLQFGKWAILGF